MCYDLLESALDSGTVGTSCKDYFVSGRCMAMVLRAGNGVLPGIRFWYLCLSTFTPPSRCAGRLLSSGASFANALPSTSWIQARLDRINTPTHNTTQKTNKIYGHNAQLGSCRDRALCLILADLSFLMRDGEVLLKPWYRTSTVPIRL